MSKTTKSETKQTNEPPSWARPLFEQSAQDAQQLYNDKSGYNVYQGQTLAPQSASTLEGMNRLEQSAGTLQGLANDSVNTLGQFDASYNKLEDTASGRMLDSNPYFDKVVDRASRDTAAMVNSSMAGAGRFGSGAHTGVLTDKIGGLQDQMRSANYQFERGNQLNAINNQAAITGNKLTGIGASMGMQAAPANALAQAGAQRDAYSQAQLNDEMQKFYAEDMQDWTRLGALQSAAAGAAGDYGTMTNMTKQTQPMNPMQIIGGLGSLFMGMPGLGLGLGGMGAGMGMGGMALGAMGPQYTPYSDARLKTDIRRVGVEPKHGLPLYEFKYCGGKETWRGVMAQDVAETVPEALVLDPSGYFRVNYGMLGLTMERVHA